MKIQLHGYSIYGECEGSPCCIAQIHREAPPGTGERIVALWNEAEKTKWSKEALEEKDGALD